MAHSLRNRTIRLAILPLQILGIVFFVLWAKDTDFLFGHFSGPPGYLIAASVLAATSIAGRVFLWAQAYRPQGSASQDSGPNDQRTAGRPLWRKGLSVLLFLFSILIVLIALLEFAESLGIIR